MRPKNDISIFFDQAKNKIYHLSSSDSTLSIAYMNTLDLFFSLLHLSDFPSTFPVFMESY